MKVFHGTTKESAEAIVTTQHFNLQLVNIYHPDRMISDLGSGIYTYCDDYHKLWCPRKNAEKYARTYKDREASSFKVLAVQIKDTESLKSLDLDDSQNLQKFVKIREKLEYRVNQIYKSIPQTGAKRRNNVDGIVIELAIKEGALPDVDVISKETYTDFDKGKLSNFPNGEELVIRHSDIIRSVEYA